MKQTTFSKECIRCWKVFHQLDEVLMDLMVQHFPLEKLQQVLPLGKDLVIRNPVITGIL
jgi:hypothetical protein